MIKVGKYKVKDSFTSTIYIHGICLMPGKSFTMTDVLWNDNMIQGLIRTGDILDDIQSKKETKAEVQAKANETKETIEHKVETAKSDSQDTKKKFKS